jgi:hypothetical protein
MKLTCTLFLVVGLTPQPSMDGCEIFAKVKFIEKFFKRLNDYYLVLFLDSRIRFYKR